MDIKELCDLEYKAERKAGNNLDSFAHLKNVAGQVMRLSIVTGKTDVGDCRKTGMLFRILGSRGNVEFLLDHYKARTAPTTVMTKSIDLKRFRDIVAMFYE